MTVSRSARAARWGGALLLALAPLPWLGLGTASANPGGQPGNEDNITICHRTNAVSNPYVVITVDPDAADGDLGNDNGKGDHYLEHTGPVFDPEADYQPPMSGDEWGDIIPPIPGVHDGLNWTPEGIAIWENGCEIPGPTPSESQTTSTATPTTSSATPTTTPPTTKPPTTKPPTTKPPTTTPPTTTPPPTETETTGSASPSTSISTSSSSAAPSTSVSTQQSGSKPEETETETEGASPAQLAKTGGETPVAGAVGISLLLIGIGILLLLGPGRLIPSYHRKH